MAVFFSAVALFRWYVVLDPQPFEQRAGSTGDHEWAFVKFAICAGLALTFMLRCGNRWGRAYWGFNAATAITKLVLYGVVQENGFTESNLFQALFLTLFAIVLDFFAIQQLKKGFRLFDWKKE